MTKRTLPEWVGSTPDANIPARVRLRVFDAHGETCHLTGRKITAADQWDVDHVIALANGGEHRETNLAPALREAHRAKTSEDVKTKAKIERVRKKHLGITSKKATLPGSRGSTLKRKINGQTVRRDEE